MTYRILLAIDILTALVIVYFFLAGLADGSVSSFNMHIWLGILAALGAVFGIATALRRASHPIFANLVLAILAVPALLYVLFIAMFVLSGARWI